VSDVEAGLRAGAGVVAGVLTGETTREELAGVPARTGLPGTALVLDSVADLLPHLT
jgi:phosphoglycolate phosphatase-like HAD superfamily hydrolase